MPYESNLYHLSESSYGYLHHQTKKTEEQKCVYIGFMDSSTPGILEGNYIYMCQVLPVVTFLGVVLFVTFSWAVLSDLH